jgi:hypothetical protein
VILTAKQLAERWEVPVQTIHTMRYLRGAPPAFKVGRELRFRVEDVEAWEDTRRDNGGPRAA